MLRIKLVKSLIGNVPRNVATVKALGLGKVNSTVLQKDSPAIRGMIHKVKHLLSVEEIAEEPAKPAKPAKKQAKAKPETTE